MEPWSTSDINAHGFNYNRFMDAMKKCAINFQSVPKEYVKNGKIYISATAKRKLLPAQDVKKVLEYLGYQIVNIDGTKYFINKKHLRKVE